MTWLWCRGRSRIRRDYGVAEHRPPTRVLRCRTAQKCYCTAAFLNCITPAGMAGCQPAFRRGSVPEVIDDGVSGFIVDSEEEALAAIRRIGTLDRRTVRAAFERRFTARRMAEDYLRHYQAVATGLEPAAAGPSSTCLQRPRLSLTRSGRPHERPKLLPITPSRSRSDFVSPKGGNFPCRVTASEDPRSFGGTCRAEAAITRKSAPTAG